MEYTNNNTPVDVKNQPLIYISNNQKTIQNNKKNIINQKNHKKNIPYFNPNLLYFDSINVASLNIRGELKSKLINLIDYMIESDIHFLHLCETHKYDKNNSFENDNDFQQNNKNNYKKLNHTLFTHTPSNRQFTIIHNPDPDNKSSGISIIIFPTLYKYIGPLFFILGRLIYATFFFKKYHQLNIINLYLPPITSDSIKYKTLDIIDKYISNKINNTNKYNYYILIGDFNINPHNNKLSYKKDNTIDTPNCDHTKIPYENIS